MKHNGAATFYGFNPPFIGGQQKVLSRQEDDRLIKNDILQLLLTVPGERVMRPTIGVNLRNFVFENMDESSIGTLRSDIITKIGSFEQRVDVLNVDLKPNYDSNSLSIKIAVVLRKDPKRTIIIEQFIKGTE